MPKYKTRDSFISYDVYLKKRETTCYYNQGLYWTDPSGGGSLPNNRGNAILSFQKAICADPYNEDAKYQLSILENILHHNNNHPCDITLDCSGCKLINQKKLIFKS
jgi:hypothetical protein